MHWISTAFPFWSIASWFDHLWIAIPQQSSKIIESESKRIGCLVSKYLIFYLKPCINQSEAWQINKSNQKSIWLCTICGNINIIWAAKQQVLIINQAKQTCVLLLVEIDCSEITSSKKHKMVFGLSYLF